MDRTVKGLLWFCAVMLLLFFIAAVVGGCMSLSQMRLLRQELVQLRDSVERLNHGLDENLGDISALCASVNEMQQWIRELFEDGNPFSKLLPD